MATTTDIAGQLAAIEAAIASGATKVSYDGKSVDYRSLAEMVAIRDSYRRQLGLPVTRRRTVASYRSGF